MRPPLIRPGSGTTGLDQIYEDIDRQQTELRRMIDTATAPNTEQARRRQGLIAARSPAGDEDRYRAIPITAEGIPGVIPDTQPEQATIRRLSR